VTRLYTGKGDDGTTGLLFGGRVPKDSAHPRACGAVDEAQAVIGVARSLCERGSELDQALTLACGDLWVLMAELATLGDRFEAPSQFVVPGQTPLAAQLDLARTVVRRAEREAVAATLSGSQVLPYLNRLSSLLWVQARWVEGEHLLSRDVRP
jgi:cob(I)alamin adenosyltransferase